MKKSKRLSKLKTPDLSALSKPRSLRRQKEAEAKLDSAFAEVPRITNETVAEHREDVLGSARKYIYPLKHSRRRAVVISLSLFLTTVIAFLVYTALDLYKFQATGGFMYDVTRVLPFPVAKAGASWVSYESYLFELRHYMHYYTSQQGVNFNSPGGKRQLANYKKQALNEVIQNAYVKQLAAKNHVGVSDQAVNNEVALLRAQNRLGASQQEFDEVLSEFWGWDEADFKRELKQQLLQQAVVAKLDTAAQSRAAAALKQAQAKGANFGKIAKTYSDDTATAGKGGDYPAPITADDPSLPPVVTAELFKLKPGQTSGIIDAGTTLEIVKVLKSHGGKLTAAHISFNLQPIIAYVQPLENQRPPHRYIHV